MANLEDGTIKIPIEFKQIGHFPEAAKKVAESFSYVDPAIIMLWCIKYNLEPEDFRLIQALHAQENEKRLNDGDLPIQLTEKVTYKFLID